MSTPIEIVRAQNDWWKHELCGFPPHTQDELYTALATVLLDAERFKALELAHTAFVNGLSFSVTVHQHLAKSYMMAHREGKLAELADRLRGETK